MPMMTQELARELQTHADDIRHLQDDLKEFKSETNMKFEQRDSRHDELEETLQGVLRSQERLNDTLQEFIKRFEGPYNDWLQSKHGPEWMKKVMSNMKLYAIIGAGALVVWKYDVILPIILKSVGQ